MKKYKNVPMIKIPTKNKLVQDIEAYLRKEDMPPYQFGKKYLKDSGAIPRLKQGSDPRLSTVIKIYTVIGGDEFIVKSPDDMLGDNPNATSP